MEERKNVRMTGLGRQTELKPYQKKSVEHILGVENAANFSVPGAGKTTITYAAISKWLEEGSIEKILVIGPTASFVPWEEEFQGCFGRPVRSRRLRGSIVSEFTNIGHAYDLFLMHFSTAMNKILEIDKSVSDSKVKSAYRDLAKKHHPDKVQHLGKAYVKAAQEKFQKIQKAYERIKSERGF